MALKLRYIFWSHSDANLYFDIFMYLMWTTFLMQWFIQNFAHTKHAAKNICHHLISRTWTKKKYYLHLIWITIINHQNTINLVWSELAQWLLNDSTHKVWNGQIDAWKDRQRWFQCPPFFLQRGWGIKTSVIFVWPCNTDHPPSHPPAPYAPTPQPSPKNEINCSYSVICSEHTTL